jgi:hypothetical protein
MGGRRVSEAVTWRVAVARRSQDGGILTRHGSRQPAATVTCRAYEVAAVRWVAVAPEGPTTP